VEKVGRFYPSAQNCGRRVERNSLSIQLRDGGAAPPSRSYIMGEQVANNRETQEVMYLHEKDGVWYILSEPKSPGLVKKEYIPVGNRLVYPKKWGRKKAAEVFIQHLINDSEEVKRNAEEKLNILVKLKEEIKDWK
jgi:hypothetical protein